MLHKPESFIGKLSPKLVKVVKEAAAKKEKQKDYISKLNSMLIGDHSDIPYVIEVIGTKSTAWHPITKLWETLTGKNIKDIEQDIYSCVAQINIRVFKDGKLSRQPAKFEREDVFNGNIALNDKGVSELLKQCPKADSNVKKYFLGDIKMSGDKKSEAKENKPAALPALIVKEYKSVTELQFLFDKQEVRIHSPREKEFWFCATDVCKILGYANAPDAVKNHCLSEPLKHRPEGATKDILYISEPDLYNLALRSSKPNAVPFRKWVTEKVLPSIRRTGSYRNEPTAEYEALMGKPAPVPALGEQLELFPDSVKLTFKSDNALRDVLGNCRKFLKDKGTEFPEAEDYIGYLLKKGIESVGFSLSERAK